MLTDLSRWSMLLFCFIGTTFLVFGGCREAAAATPSPFRIMDLDARHEVFYDFDSKEQSPGTDQSRHRLEQTLYLGADAFLYHPRLLDLDLNIGLGTSHERSKIDGGESGSWNEARLEHDVRGVFLKDHPYTLDVFSTYGRRYLPRNFTSSYREEIENYGAGFSFKKQAFPFRLYYTKHKTSTDGLELERDNDVATWGGQCNFVFDLMEKTHNSRTNLKFYQQDREELIAGNTRFGDIRFLDAANYWTWRQGDRVHRLKSVYYLRKDRGTDPEHSETWIEDLTLQVGRALEIGGVYEQRKQELTGLGRKDRETRVWARHKLYKSLQTFIEVSRHNSDYNEGAEDVQSRLIELSYNKLLPLKSTLFARVGYGKDEVDNDNLSTTRSIFNENLVIVDISPNFLSEPNVVPDSVVVRDTDRTILYTENVDYELREVGARTEIVRIPTGLITEGQVLSIDYLVEVDPSVEYEVTTQRYELGTSLFDNRYYLVARTQFSKQKHVEGEAEVFRAKDRSLLELQGRANFMPWILETQLGRTYREDIGREYYALNSLKYQWKPDKGKSLTAGLFYDYRLYEDVDDNPAIGDTDQVLRLQGHFRNRLNQRWSMGLRGDLGQRWGRAENRTSWNEELIVAYRYNLLQVEFRGVHRQSRVDGLTSSDITVDIRIVRKYF